MRNIKITLLNNKRFTVENLDEIDILEDEFNATNIEIVYPEEYSEHSKRIDFLNIRGEKWTTSLYAPEDKNHEYDENFDKLKFKFDIPNAMAKRGELQIQPIAYIPGVSVIPFKIIIAKIDKSIVYANKQGKEMPDLIIKAYEYSNKAVEIADEAYRIMSNTEHMVAESHESAVNASQKANECQASAKDAETSSKSAQASANASQSSATSAQTSASQAQQSAKNAETSAKNAEQSALTATNNSTTAVNTSNSAKTNADKALEIVENITVSSEEIDCEGKTKVEIQTNSQNKHKNIKFSIPAPKKGTSYRNKGMWSASATYVNDQYYIDTVYLFGTTYYCKVSNTNQQPLNMEESDYWGIIALKGSDAGVTIIDNLNSDNAGYVLSAKQGKVLKELIASTVENAITSLVSNAPSGRDTLNELSVAIDNLINNTTKIQASNGSVQLGSGTNNSANTLQFRGYQLVNSSGNIPMARLLNSVYPVGSIYMSVNSTSPQTLFGGTWVKFEGGYSLVSTNGTNGGDESTTSAKNHIPGQTFVGGLPNIVGEVHGGEGFLNSNTSSGALSSGGSIGWRINGVSGDRSNNLYFDASKSNDRYGKYQGNGSAVIPDHIAVYMWKRTA